MRNTRAIVITIFAFALMWGCRCGKKPGPDPVLDMGGFPDAVGKIIVGKCATAGCHNAASYMNSAGLLLDTWQHLFDGGNSGSSVIPYSAEFSPLLYFVNTDPARGTVATPTMPFDPSGVNANKLSEEEYNTLKEWITNGAPDRNGNIAFAADADTRQKVYVTQQGCDLVAVIDAASGLVMRYIKVGTNAGTTESPHCLRTSADGRYAYVSFIGGTGIQKIDTRTDQVANTTTLGVGSWNILYVAPHDTMVATTDCSTNGRIVYTRTGSMTIAPELTGSGSGLFVFPHGITSNEAFDTCYISAQYGNTVYKWAPTVPYYKAISIDGSPTVVTTPSDLSSPNPHEIMMIPDRSRYFLTCERTNEVRVLDARTDAILAAIPVGTRPQEIAMARTRPYAFITCMEDENVPSGRRGSVYVIDYNTYEVVKVIKGDFYQPHGITVDEYSGRVYIVSTNASDSGPAPHHATACFGRPGWYSIYSLNTLEPVNTKRYQVTVMPYSADVRFK
ncbi:hypothetical protein GCM10023093_08450 [Nemorincola caseinilytica]|uniref:Cytochrome C Planctomycete-type domain-containing protein n=1 Tax=Nemorincola caseinilytica TaxID=2054315 RepID=A0ABP8N9H1_9BACT